MTATRQRFSPGERQACLPWIEGRFPSVRRPQVSPALVDRVRGMLLGLAIGDALGHGSEGLNLDERRRRFGEIRDYVTGTAGLPTDDTQLAFWTVESLLRCVRVDPDDLARSFAQDRIFGIGGTVRAFLRAHKDEGRPWWQAGRPSAGNGALMRIAPVILPWLWGVSPQPWEDTVVATVVTHRDEAAVTASVGFVGLLCEALAGGTGVAVERATATAGAEGDSGAVWWPETFLHYARVVETAAIYRPRSPHIFFEGTLCQFVERFVLPAVRERMNPVAASRAWYSGAYLLETVPMALLILACHWEDPEEAIVRAVNDTRDNDTIGAIVGAVVGAVHGAQALPERWRANLLGRTREADDGHVQQLIEQAVARLGEGRAIGKEL